MRSASVSHTLRKQRQVSDLNFVSIFGWSDSAFYHITTDTQMQHDAEMVSQCHVSPT